MNLAQLSVEMILPQRVNPFNQSGKPHPTIHHEVGPLVIKLVHNKLVYNPH